jgi:hypothetical protein
MREFHWQQSVKKQVQKNLEKKAQKNTMQR